MKALAQAPSTKLRHKLRHSLLALSVVGAASGAALFLAEPLPSDASPAPVASAELEDKVLVEDAAATATTGGNAPGPVDDAQAASASSNKSRRSRHSAAMPFFSFSVRG